MLCSIWTANLLYIPMRKNRRFFNGFANFVRHQMILCKQQLIGNISNAKANSKKIMEKTTLMISQWKPSIFNWSQIDYNCCRRYMPQIVFLIPIKYQISLITKQQQKHLRTLLSMMDFFLVHQCRLGQFI